MATSKDTIALAKTFYALFNERKLDDMTKLVAGDVTWSDTPTAQVFQGPTGFKAFVQGWLTAFPDARVEIQQQVASEDAVVTEFVARGTHQGPLASPHGSIPPTGRKLDMRFCEVMRLANGKVTEGRVYYDTTTLLRQLGVSPESLATR